MDVLYHTIITAGLLLASPFFLSRALVDKSFRREMKERLGGWRNLKPPPAPIWIHAASVGEVKLALTLVEHLAQAIPDHKPVLSTFTWTGFEVAQKAAACPVFLMPPDSPLFLTPLLERLQPATLVLIEAELWPGLLRTCHRRGIPMLQLNGRMSEGSMTRYKNLNPLFPWMAEGVHFFAMRTQADAQRLKKLGLADCRIGVTGNMKYDAMHTPRTNGAGHESDLIVFGSTRPGDETAALDAIEQLKDAFPQARYVIAPRHMDRVDEVEALIKARGLEVVRHSKMAAEKNFSPFVILVDVLGVLNDYYEMAEAAYVGGGFRPEFGGQNILEPALCAIPVLFGPEMQNFEEEARLLRESGGGLQLESEDQLFTLLKFLLENPEERRQLGQQAAEAVAKQRGAVERNVEIIRESLKFAPNA